MLIIGSGSSPPTSMVSAYSFISRFWRCWLNKADNDRQGDDADEQPKQNSLQERPPADGAERLRREPCPDQKQRERQTGCGHVPQCGGYAGHPRHETASHRGEQEKADKPRHLHLGLKLRSGLAVSLGRSEDGRCAQAHWDNPKSTREFDRRSRLQSVQPVMRARTDH